MDKSIFQWAAKMGGMIFEQPTITRYAGNPLLARRGALPSISIVPIVNSHYIPLNQIPLTVNPGCATTLVG
jgi:hypothetical protein